jgi:ATP-dependent DNA helicase RecG
VAGRLNGPPSVKFHVGTPLLRGYLEDRNGLKIGFSTFGDSRKFEKDLRSQTDRVILFGKLEFLDDGRPWLKAPELVPEEWLGRLRPRYPGKAGVVKPDTVRERVVSTLEEAIPLAADFLARELASFGSRQELAELAGLPQCQLETLLRQAHFPQTLERGRMAQEGLERLAALGIIASASGGQAPQPCTKSLDLPDWRPLAAAIPFALTSEQEHAISDALADIASVDRMHRIISGDVGTGKTAVMGVVAAAVVEAGGNVACLLPNESLAGQIFRELTEWWPDLPVQLLTGSHRDDALCGSMVVGTTAILHQDLGYVDLCSVDEQHKMGRSQREQLVGPDTHLLEMTATCIPRTQALLRYGVVKVSRLTQCHTKKQIHTRIWHKNETAALFAQVKESLAAGDQVLLVYPLREKGEEDPEAETPEASRKLELKNVVEEYSKWERLFPGQVRLVHGQMAAVDKDAALDDMCAGRAAILVATTVVEVGINIPLLRRIVIVHPDRMVCLPFIRCVAAWRVRVARAGVTSTSPTLSRSRPWSGCRSW